MALKYLLLNETGLFTHWNHQKPSTADKESFSFKLSIFPSLFSKYHPEQKTCSLRGIQLPVLRMISLSVDYTNFICLPFSLIKTLKNKEALEKWREWKIWGIAGVWGKDENELSSSTERIKGLAGHSYQIKAGSMCTKSSQSCEEA